MTAESRDNRKTEPPPPNFDPKVADGLASTAGLHERTVKSDTETVNQRTPSREKSNSKEAFVQPKKRADSTADADDEEPPVTPSSLSSYDLIPEDRE